MLSMESCQTSLQVLEKLCVVYGKLSVATGVYMESSQTSLQVLEKLCAEYGKFSDIATGTGKTVC